MICSLTIDDHETTQIIEDIDTSSYLEGYENIKPRDPVNYDQQ